MKKWLDSKQQVIMHLGVFNIDSSNAYKLTKGNQVLSLNFIFDLKQKNTKNKIK